MAEYQIKGTVNRTSLEQVIPLQTPFRVMLEVSSLCNFRCSFCAHSQESTPPPGRNKIMPFELALKCIDDLKSFPQKIKSLSLFNNGEPLLNKKLPEIIRYAKDAQVADRIDFTTNASLMTREMADKIINAGIDLINISIYGLDEEQYFRTSNIKINFDEFIENLKYLYEIRGTCKIAIKITDAAFTADGDKERFFNIYSNICDTISVEHVVPMYYEINYSETYEENFNIYGGVVTKKELCPVSFYTVSVSPDGKASPCCIDTQYKLAFGDANKESLVDIWNGGAYRNFYIKQLTDGRRSITPCRNCNYPDYVAMDNIDQFREEILKKFS